MITFSHSFLVAGALMTSAGFAHANAPACGTPEIKSAIVQQGTNHVSQWSEYLMGQAAKPEADYKLALSDVFEISRTEVIRQCAGNLKATLPNGANQSVAIQYQAIITEDNNVIFRWENMSEDTKSLAAGLSIANVVVENQARHPGMSPKEAEQEILKPPTGPGTAHDMIAKSNAADPTRNVGAGGGNSGANHTELGGVTKSVEHKSTEQVYQTGCESSKSKDYYIVIFSDSQNFLLLKDSKRLTFYYVTSVTDVDGVLKVRASTERRDNEVTMSFATEAWQKSHANQDAPEYAVYAGKDGRYKDSCGIFEY